MESTDVIDLILITIIVLLLVCVGTVAVKHRLAAKQEEKEQIIEPPYVDEAHRVVSTYFGMPNGDIKKLIITLRSDGRIEHIDTKILMQDEKICIDAEE